MADGGRQSNMKDRAGHVARRASAPAPSPPFEFFTRELAAADAAVDDALVREEERQRGQLELIAPKNYMSRAARQALASIIAFISVEGYPGERWHAGTVNLDQIEDLATSRARELFRCRYANVQPHSGTQANQAVFFALLGGYVQHAAPGRITLPRPLRERRQDRRRPPLGES